MTVPMQPCPPIMCQGIQLGCPLNLRLIGPGEQEYLGKFINLKESRWGEGHPVPLSQLAPIEHLSLYHCFSNKVLYTVSATRKPEWTWLE